MARINEKRFKRLIKADVAGKVFIRLEWIRREKMSKNGNTGAYPVPNDVPEDYEHTSVDGLTKREYFAGLAMQGRLGNEWTYSDRPEDVAKESVEYADALLAELENTNEQ